MEPITSGDVYKRQESTRPGAHPITAAEELRRLVPVLKRLRGQLNVPISVDTYKAEVAERALELGVEIINDASGFTIDPLLAKPIVCLLYTSRCV